MSYTTNDLPRKEGGLQMKSTQHRSASDGEILTFPLLWREYRCCTARGTDSKPRKGVGSTDT